MVRFTVVVNYNLGRLEIIVDFKIHVLVVRNEMKHKVFICHKMPRKWRKSEFLHFSQHFSGIFPLIFFQKKINKGIVTVEN